MHRASADPRQRVADELVHHPPAAEARSRPAPSPAARCDLADLGGVLAARHGAQRGERRLGATRARRRRRAGPRWRRTSGRCRASRAAPATAGCDRHVGLAHEHRHARGACQLVEHARRRRRGSRRACSEAPARRRRAARRPPATASAVSDSISASRLELAAREHDRRAVLADRARDEDAVAGPQAARARAPRAGRRRPMPVVQTYISSRVAALDDLRVAGDDLDAGRARPRRRSPRPRRAARRRRRPSSRTSESRERERPGAGDREVVDRAVDRQLADRAAREADRLARRSCRWSARARRHRPRPRRRRRAPRASRSRRPARAAPRSASASPCRRRRGPS